MSNQSIDKAIYRRWNAQGLEAKFKAYWSDPTESAFHALNDTDAPANTPMPFCLYERGMPFRTARSTGSECEPANYVEYWTIPVQFTVKAPTRGRGSNNFGRSGKDICAELVGQSEPDGSGILKAFDDATGALDFSDTNDRHVQTILQADYSLKEDDDVWAWVIMIDIEIERRRLQR
jgi:hypothetical protein